MDVMTDIALDFDTSPAPRIRFESRPNAAIAARAAGVPVLDVVIPVYNEQAALADSVYRLHRHLRDDFPFPARITIADNASVDDTPRIAHELAAELTDVRVVRVEQKGRGRALHAVWATSDAPVLAYMDVDLSTDLAALAPLVAPLISGHSDVAIGTRLSRGARVVRGPKREIISRCYNLILKSTLAAGFSDAQCGFKAIRADVANACFRTSPTPAGSSTPSCWYWPSGPGCGSTRSRWTGSTTPTQGSTSSPPPWPTCAASSASAPGWPAAPSAFPVLGNPSPPALRPQAGDPRAGRHGQLVGQLARFVVVGVASTAAYVLLYLLFRGVMTAQAANAISLLLTAVANTAVNRRFTFGIRGRMHAARHQLRGLIAFGIGLAVTSGALVALHAVSARPSRAAEVAVLIAANLVATVVRFALYRGWVFRGHGGRAGPPARQPSPPARGARPETAADLVQRQLLDLSE